MDMYRNSNIVNTSVGLVGQTVNIQEILGDLGVTDNILATGSSGGDQQVPPTTQAQALAAQEQGLHVSTTEPAQMMASPQQVVAQAIDIDQLKALLSNVVQETTMPAISALQQRMTDVDLAMREGRRRALLRPSNQSEGPPNGGDRLARSEGPLDGERPQLDPRPPARSEDPHSGKRSEPEGTHPQEQARGKRLRHTVPSLPVSDARVPVGWTPQEDQLSLGGGSDFDDDASSLTRSPQDPHSSSDEEEEHEDSHRVKSVVQHVPQNPAGETDANQGETVPICTENTFRAIMTAHLPTESWGPPLIDFLEEPLRQVWNTPVDKNLIATTAAKYETPSNARYLRVQRTNSEIFRLANSQGRAQDAAVQARQDTNIRAATATLQALSVLMTLPKGEPVGEETLRGIFQNLWDSMSLMAHANNEMLAERRSRVARSLPEQYMSLRNTSYPDSEQLFGNDPAGLLDQVAKDHKRAQEWKKGGASNNNRRRKPRNNNNNNNSHEKSQPWYKRRRSSKNSKSRSGDRRTKDPKASATNTKAKKGTKKDEEDSD